MHRFFLPGESFTGPRIRITGEVADQVRRVLRMRPGDPLTLLDGLGYEYKAVLRSYGKGEAWVDVLERNPVTTEPRLQVTLYLSMLNKAEKFEWALQKCTELGAARFVPLLAERSVSERLSASRRSRWERIIQEASEQSGRGLLPPLADVMSLRDAIAEERRRVLEAEDWQHIALMPEVDQERSLRDTLGVSTTPLHSASLFIGPEGGFTRVEVEAAAAAGVTGVSLGPRILRAETAAVAGLAILMSISGEMDSWRTT